MDVREYLKNYNQIGDEIRRLNAELNRLIECREDTYNTLQAQKNTEMPRINREYGEDVVSKTALNIIEQFSSSIGYLTFRINRLLNMQEKFNRVWFQEGLLSSVEKKIIDLRYFQNLTWSKVKKYVFYSERQFLRISERVINRLQEELNKID